MTSSIAVAYAPWGKMQRLNNMYYSALVATILALSPACVPGPITGDGDTSSETSDSGAAGDTAGDSAPSDLETGDGDGDATTTGDGDGDGGPATTGDGDGDGDRHNPFPCCYCDTLDILTCVAPDDQNQCPEGTSATLISCE